MENVKNPMGTKPIFPLLMGMSIPPMVSMLIQSMYNIVDSIFVAKLGEDALTAVTIAFPLQNMILAVAVGLGVGVNAAIAISLGARNKESVNSAATHGVFYTGIHFLAFIIFGLCFTKPFLSMFTNNPDVLKWSCIYSYIVLCFSFGSLFHITIEKMFQATGNMVMPMIMQAFGAVINIILDPILIFGLLGFPAMGVKGAAIATVIGQISACALSVFLFRRNPGGIHICFRKFRPDGLMTKQLYAVAIPSALMMSMPSILIGALNGILGAISQTSVAVLGIYFKLQTFVYMPATGVIQGMRPIISYNYGAGRTERLKGTIKVSLGVIAVIMALGTALFILFPSQILKMFSASKEMESMGVLALRIIGTGFVVSSFGQVFAGVFESMRKGMYSLLVSLLRQLVIIIPLSLVLVRFLGVTGVWITFPVAETAAAAVSALLLLRVMREVCNEK